MTVTILMTKRGIEIGKLKKLQKKHNFQYLHSCLLVWGSPGIVLSDEELEDKEVSDLIEAGLDLACEVTPYKVSAPDYEKLLNTVKAMSKKRDEYLLKMVAKNKDWEVEQQMLDILDTIE